MYAVHKALAETLFLKLACQHPDISLTILRPCMILGPHMDNFSCRMARTLSVLFAARGYNPRLQFVHEDDVVAVFARAIREDMPGTYNVVGSGTIDLTRLYALFNKLVLRIGFHLLCRDTMA